MVNIVLMNAQQGYLPLPASLRTSTLARKRSEYLSLVELTFARNKEGLDQPIWHQIEIDVPRTRPGVPLWMHASTQRVRAVLSPGLQVTENKSRAWNEYCTCGRFDTQRADTYKESTTL